MSKKSKLLASVAMPLLSISLTVQSAFAGVPGLMNAVERSGPPALVVPVQAPGADPQEEELLKRKRQQEEQHKGARKASQVVNALRGRDVLKDSHVRKAPDLKASRPEGQRPPLRRRVRPKAAASRTQGGTASRTEAEPRAPAQEPQPKKAEPPPPPPAPKAAQPEHAPEPPKPPAPPAASERPQPPAPKPEPPKPEPAKPTCQARSCACAAWRCTCRACAEASRGRACREGRSSAACRSRCETGGTGSAEARRTAGTASG